ncbi:hypothetical protein BS78_10G222400 [Paspalum vaginatum]|nr:hypothetical protein BS78_10G222400 [Paspalum vaginatum]
METLTEVVQSSKQIKIQGYSLTSAMSDGEVLKSSRWNVGGYEWEVQVLPKSCEVPMDSSVDVTFASQLVDQSEKLKPHQVYYVSHKFKRSGDNCSGRLMRRCDFQGSGYLKDDAVRELHNKAARPSDTLDPSSSLSHNLGDPLQKGTGADVTFVVAGESFAAHKAILASRSPVFMAEFFGHMKEKRSQRVEIKGMQAAVFGAMLRFIYTDSVPELDHDLPEDDGVAMAQHLLAAADRYGIDRLKLTCEDRLYDGHGCSHLKAKCVEVIAANLEAVMATDGYMDLVAICPSVMNDLLMAVHGRKNTEVAKRC